ncbi:MAG: hypothetical protein WDO70_11140 [Alphaproteobacteria bacterium]
MPLQQANVEDRVRADAGAHSFLFCHGYGCRYSDQVSFSGAEWAGIAAMMPRAPDAAAERGNLAKTIGHMRVMAAKKTGTEHDLPAAPMLRFVDPSQLDCVDETHNAFAYLRLLEGAGLLRFHKTAAPVARGYTPMLTAGHHSASVAETASGTVYAVDPTARKLGDDAEITAFPDWIDKDPMPTFVF